MADCWECENKNTQMCEGCKDGYMDGIDGWIQFDEPTHFIPKAPSGKESEDKKMNGSFEFTLNNPLTKEDWDKIMDVELENTPSITFKTPKGKQVKYIKSDILDKIRKEIVEREIALKCTEVADIASKRTYIETLKIIDKYKKESEE